MKITWEVDYDAARGGQRTHHSHVEERDIIDCGSVEEAMRMIEEEVRSDFDNVCRPTIVDDTLDRVKTIIAAAKAKERP